MVNKRGVFGGYGMPVSLDPAGVEGHVIYQIAHKTLYEDSLVLEFHRL
jgi:hypothetical protein